MPQRNLPGTAGLGTTLAPAHDLTVAIPPPRRDGPDRPRAARRNSSAGDAVRRTSQAGFPALAEREVRP